MKLSLSVFAGLVFVALVAVSVWATGHQALVAAISDLVANPAAHNNPWFVATLFDAYFGFLWFWLWVAYKQTTWISRLLWLALILLLGNIAMAAFVLLQLWRLPKGAGLEQLLLRRPSAST